MQDRVCTAEFISTIARNSVASASHLHRCLATFCYSTSTRSCWSLDDYDGRSACQDIIIPLKHIDSLESVFLVKSTSSLPQTSAEFRSAHRTRHAPRDPLIPVPQSQTHRHPPLPSDHAGPTRPAPLGATPPAHETPNPGRCIPPWAVFWWCLSSGIRIGAGNRSPA